MRGPPLLPGIAPPDPLRRVPAATPHPAVVELAAAAPPGLRCGPSSWTYPGWGDRVWARALPDAELSRYGLPAVAAFPVFRAIGVDRTFHAPVSEPLYRTWAAQAPEVRFVIKAPAALTRPRDGEGPSPAFLDPGRAQRDLVAPAVRGLGPTLGHLLLQFAASATREAGGADAFIRSLTALLSTWPAEARPAVELRDPHMVTRRMGDALAACGAVPCLDIQPGMPPLADQAAALVRPHQPLLVRWMTRPGLTYAAARARFSPFDHLRGADPVTRRALAQLIVEHLDRGQPVTVTVANRAEGCIPVTVVGLVEAVGALRRRRAGRPAVRRR